MTTCPNCGEVNPGRARFCLACAAPLEAGNAPPYVRKTVTVVFCDLVESTALTTAIEPEALRLLLARYFDEARAVIERHGGTVEKFIGDAIMAVFGVPQVHEDDALRAVRAAFELRSTTSALSEHSEETMQVHLGVRIGVATGRVVTGDGRGDQVLVTGETVNLAKRLEEAGGEGEILVSERTRQLLEGRASLAPVEPVQAKGWSVPLTAWRVIGLARAETRLDAPLIGRRRELEALESILDVVVAENSCRLVTVFGPAGIGKSRLAQEFTDVIRDRAAVLGGRCLPYGEGITYWPLAQALRDAGGLEAVRRALEDDHEAGHIADLVWSAVAGPTGAADGDEIFWGIRRLLEALARRRPLVVCFEDIHWAEPTFLDLLEYLVGWSNDAPILLVCLARPELLEDHRGWLAGVPNAAQVVLEPLAAVEAGQLLDQLAAGRFDEPTRLRIAEAAEGNPLYVEQLVAYAVEDRDPSAPLEVPPTIQALLEARLDRLGREDRAVLERAAVFGKQFSRRVLLELSPPSGRPDLTSRLMSLVRKGLIRPQGQTAAGDERFAFRHALIRDAAYAGVALESRARLHERVAGWLTSEPELEPEELEEIAGYHLEQAVRQREQLGPLDDAARSLARRGAKLLTAAGKRALDRGDTPAAANLLDRGAALASGRDRLLVLPDLAEALRASGDFSRAAGLLDEAIAAAEAAGDTRLLSRARITQAIVRLYADGEMDGLSPVAKEAIRVFEEIGDDAGLAGAWYLMSYDAFCRCRFRELETVCDRVLEHARRAGDQRHEAAALRRLALAVSLGPTPVRDAIARCGELRLLAAPSRAADAAIAAMSAELEAMRGRFDDARAVYAQSKETLADLGNQHELAGVALFAAPVEFLAGDLDAAERELRSAAETLAALGESSTLSTVSAYLARVLFAQGRTEEAAAAVEASSRFGSPRDVLAEITAACTRARLLADEGRVEEAQQLAESTLELARTTESPTLVADALLDLANVRGAAGREEDALEAVRGATELYEAKGNAVARDRSLRLAGELTGVEA